MKEKADVISKRLLDYGAEIIKLCGKLKKDTVGSHIKGQLLRSATSAGANYEEACGAQSKADFYTQNANCFKRNKRITVLVEINRKNTADEERWNKEDNKGNRRYR